MLDEASGGTGGVTTPMTSASTGMSGAESGAGGSVAGASGSVAPQAGAYAGPSGEAGQGGQPSVADAGHPAPEEPGESLMLGVGSWGLRGRSRDGADWTYCGNASTGNDHSPDLLRAIGYGDGVFIAVGGDANGMVMRSLDGEHWEQDVHPLSACPGETYPSSCNNWMGAVAYLDGVWLAGGGNGATMRSEDAGRTWQTLYSGFPEKHIRALGSGAGRFIAGTDGGGLWVTSDRGDSWSAKNVWSGAAANAVLRVSFGRGTFVAFSSAADACFVSTDLGDSWQACATEVQGGTSYVFDGEQWVASMPSAYATSADALTWTTHTVATMPRELAFDGSSWLGRGGSHVYRGSSLDDFERVATNVADFRAWTLGKVLTKNLPVSGLPACQDLR